MYDILIIGSGPAGLSAAIYAKRANRRVAVIEKEYMGTGQIANSERVDNYLGIPEINGFDLGEKFRAHAESLEVEFIDNEVTLIEEENADRKIWKLTLDNGTILETKTVIYTAGASPKRLGIKGEDAFLGKGISFCAICDGAFYKDKDVLVIGGGDTAIDDALFLSDIAKTVYLVHRREGFRAAQVTVDLLRKKDNVKFYLNKTVEEVIGQTKLEKAILSDGNILEVDGVFEAIGSKPATNLLEGIIELDEAGYVKAGEDGITNKDGFFVAGDVRTKSLRQVVTAVSDGANASTSADNYLMKY